MDHAENQQLEYQTRLARVSAELHEAEEFAEAMPLIEPDLLKILNAARVTVYVRGRNRNEIVSKFKSGQEIKEIKVPLSPSSIAGYVALSQSTVRIVDAYNADELRAINPKLNFAKDFDLKSGFRTKSVIAIPIKFKDVLLGVLQALNRNDGKPFDDQDEAHAAELAHLIGQKFRYELRGTRSPYDHLVQTKRITADDLKLLTSRAEKEGTKVDHLLLTEVGITPTELGTAYERYYQVPFMLYDPNLQIPAGLLSGINVDYLRKQLWVPIAGGEDELTILIDDPTDAQKVMEIQRTIPAKRYVFKVGFADDILRYLGQGNGVPGGNVDLHDLVGRLQVEAEADISQAEDQVDENEATVIQLVNRLILDAHQAGASDIHIEPGKGKANATVRFRVDGACRPSLTIPHTHVRAVVSRIKIMSALDISERRKPQDGKCAVIFRGQPIELRIATVPTVNGESVVIRLLSSGEPLPLSALNLSARNLKEIEDLSGRPHGLFLVVGPTGSGKTTTLHSVLKHINTPDRKIWTAEDPVEITQLGLQQLQVKADIGLTFATALRSFLRADPDVIMIGEMRDKETAHAGIEASLTGHLVFSTLHTNSAPETITRLLDLGVDPVSFADALHGVLAQRPARTLCAKCKEERPITPEELDNLRRYYGAEYFDELNVSPEKTKLFHPKGCSECRNSGYKGRIAIHELLVNGTELRSLIYKGAPIQEIKAAAIKAGMRTLMQDGIAKVLIGKTDLGEIRKVALA